MEVKRVTTLAYSVSRVLKVTKKQNAGYRGLPKAVCQESRFNNLVLRMYRSKKKKKKRSISKDVANLLNSKSIETEIAMFCYGIV